MAARQLQRRISTVLFQRQPYSPFVKDRKFVAPVISMFNTYRGIQAEAAKSITSTELAVKEVENHDGGGLSFSAVSNLKTSHRHDLAMVFTCKVCETRSVKTCSREAYEKGVVVAKCAGCNNIHLLADHLGFFGEPSTVEKLLAERGEEVKKGSAETLSLTLGDLAGTKTG